MSYKLECKIIPFFYDWFATAKEPVMRIITRVN